MRLILLLLGTFSKLLYHQLAWTYDLVSSIVSAGSWKKWVGSVAPYLIGPRVLEIGFGPGHLLVAMHQKKLTGYGLDESHQMARIAKNRLLRQGGKPNLTRGEAQTLPFADESFEQVVMTFPAEYILKPATFSEIKRVLTQGGTTLILPFAWVTGRKPVERLVAWINHVTGEAPEWDPKIMERLKVEGFEATWEMINFSNSRIILIRLIKL